MRGEERRGKRGEEKGKGEGEGEGASCGMTNNSKVENTSLKQITILSKTENKQCHMHEYV